MSVLQGCYQLVTLQHPTIVQGARGGQNPSNWMNDDDAVEVPCSIQPASASRMLRYMQMKMQVSHTLYFEYPYNVFLGDRWKLIDENFQLGTLLGRIFVVRGWKNASEQDDVWECDCEEQRVPLQVGVNA